MGKANAKQLDGFRHWLFELDRILRGEATRPSDIQNADIKFPVVGVSVIVILLAITYGFCMGIFALVRGVENSAYQGALLQTFASMCKVPLLFFMTLVVTFPSLYVFNALVGSKLKVFPVLKLLVASLAVNLAVLASMGPILAFFSVSTPNYHFIVLLNVVVFGVAGVLGLAFLVQTLNRLSLSQQQRLTPAPTVEVVDRPLATKPDLTDRPDLLGQPQPQSPRQLQPSVVQDSTKQRQRIARGGPLDRIDGAIIGLNVRKVFTVWMLVFGLVGAQMGWVLRPFIGSPNRPFQLFRERHSNFFEAVLNTLWEFLF